MGLWLGGLVSGGANKQHFTVQTERRDEWMAALKDVSLLRQKNLDKDVTQVCSSLASPHFHLQVRFDWHWFIRYFLQERISSHCSKIHSPKLQCATSYCCVGNYVFLVWLNTKIYTGTMGSNSQNLRTAYLGEFLSLCLANQGEVIHATPLEAVCFAHCTYHLVLSPRS